MKNTFKRRDFGKLCGTSFAVAAASQILPLPDLTAKQASGKEAILASEIAMLSDTHISADPNAEARGIKMADHLSQAVGQVVDQLPKGSHVVVNGDCAYLNGLAEDYKTFAKLIAPLTEAGMKLHVTLGNHDDRGPLYDLLPSQRQNDLYAGEKHVDVISLPGVDLVLLDSLWKVNQVTGQFGAGQLNWLRSWLENDSARPVIVIGHHNLQFQKTSEDKKITGVKDSGKLAELLANHPRVKAYCYGHTHRWEHTRLALAGDDRSSLDLVNLPAVAYVFDQKQPSGWVHAKFDSEKMDLKLHSLNATHPKHQQQTSVSLT